MPGGDILQLLMYADILVIKQQVEMIEVPLTGCLLYRYSAQLMSPWAWLGLAGPGWAWLGLAGVLCLESSAERHSFCMAVSCHGGWVKKKSWRPPRSSLSMLQRFAATDGAGMWDIGRWLFFGTGPHRL